MSDFRTIQQLACIPRGEHGELRIELTECADDRGNASQFVNCRLWYKGDKGDMLPGKQGLTIRKTEIHDVGRALRAALDAMKEGVPPAQQTRTAPSARVQSDTKPPAGRQVGAQRGAPSPQQRPFDDDDEARYTFDADLSAGGRL